MGTLIVMAGSMRGIAGSVVELALAWTADGRDHRESTIGCQQAGTNQGHGEARRRQPQTRCSLLVARPLRPWDSVSLLAVCGSAGG